MTNSEDQKLNSNIIMNIDNKVDDEKIQDNKNIDKGLINEKDLSKWEDERNSNDKTFENIICENSLKTLCVNRNNSRSHLDLVLRIKNLLEDVGFLQL